MNFGKNRHLLLRIAFQGGRYHGFQVQKNGITVAQTLQDAIEQVFGCRHDIKGCSRTDAGVHARDFAVSFHTNSAIPCDNVVQALNVKLPFDVVVKSCMEVREDFHPRYDAVAKQYVYQIASSPVRDPFRHGLCFYTSRTFDVAAMDMASRYFVGVHDFSAFTNTGGNVQDKVRCIMESYVQAEKDMIFFSVTGNGFLYNMVRIMIGTLMEVGLGRRQIHSVKQALASQCRDNAGPTAPSCGLYLEQVFYDWDRLP